MADKGDAKAAEIPSTTTAEGVEGAERPSATEKEKDAKAAEADPAKAAEAAEAAPEAKTGTKDAACKFIKSTLTSLNDLSKESGCPEEAPAAAAGGRRRKRSMRRSRRSSKGGRRSRKGGKSRKGRKSRGRSNKSKGGAKMGKELKAWMKRQKTATGITPISKATIAATKTNPQSTGSAQRSESSKHVAAQARGL